MMLRATEQHTKRQLFYTFVQIFTHMGHMRIKIRVDVYVYHKCVYR